MTQEALTPQRPTGAFIGASWAALLIGMGSYLIGLLNADLALVEKGYYFTLLLFGLFSAISVQKAVRDRAEGVSVTNIYYGISWFCTLAALVLLGIGLWNSTMALSEKGFYGVALAMALFAVVAVQKNVRDLAAFAKEDSKKESEAKAAARRRPPFIEG